MSEIFSSTPFILLLVLGSYLAGCKLYRKKHIALFHPLLVAMVLIIALLSLLDIDYDTFCAGSSFISFLLGPSVVALGYALYEQIEQIRGKEIPVLTAVFAGGIVGIVSVIAICRIMGVDEAITSSLQPKSVTIPIAISLSEHSNAYRRSPQLSYLAAGFWVVSSVLPFSTAATSTAE